MISWLKILRGKRIHPDIPNLRVSNDTLFFDSLTRGTLVSGNPGTGKTTWLASVLLDYAEMYPTRPIILLDASGSLTNDLIELISALPPERREPLYRRFIYDRPGDENETVTRPFFHHSLGLTEEEQVQRAYNVIRELNPERLARNPTMSRAIVQTAVQLFRLLQVIKNEHGESWQVTEGKKLLNDSYPDGLLATAVSRFGGIVPTAKDFFEKRLLKEKLSAVTRSTLIDSLLDALQTIESKPLRARYGHHKPTVTIREVIDNGLILAEDGSMLNNQKDAQAWVFWSSFLELKYLINKRTPHADDVPVLVVFDEAYQLFRIQGMAEEIGQISAYYRSRKLQPIMIIQAMWQLDELLKEQIWNFGNLVTFSLDNQKDAYMWAQQAIKYDPKTERLPAVSETGQPILEQDTGQYLAASNWIQRSGQSLSK